MRGLDLDSLGFKDPSQTRIVVAMSGGVDSSVVAALLHEAGFDVVGITLQLYDYGQAIGKKGACCAGQDIYDAAQVAERLDFPHYVLDYESVFKESVIDDFADSYLRGETPIPCIKCNQKVKFRDLFKVARDLGGMALATGHYVQRSWDGEKATLHKAYDPKKDQSYFLFATTQAQLDYLRFPLGHLSKEETRVHAQRLGLDIAEKPDSQDICFVPDGDYARVVERLRPGSLEAGDIVDQEGQVLGQHAGIINYTIGQRRGLNLSHNPANGEPLFVIKLDPIHHRVIVGPKSALVRTNFLVENLNWLGVEESTLSNAYMYHVKIRSSQVAIPARITVQSERGARVELLTPEFGVAAGQACVFYEGDKVLGGGWIQRDV